MRVNSLAILTLALLGLSAFATLTPLHIDEGFLTDADATQDLASWTRHPNTKPLPEFNIENGEYLVENKKYFSCAGPEENTEFTYARDFGTLRCGRNIYLARYGAGNDVVTANIAFDQKHFRGVVVRFQLILIDSWIETEQFYVDATIDGTATRVYALDGIRNEQTTDDAEYNLCGNTCYNEHAEQVKFGFNYEGQALTLVFGAAMKSNKVCAKSWGVCDVEIQTVHCPVDKNGDCLPHPPFFDCFQPIMEKEWSYEPEFRRFRCGKSAYLGQYSNGQLAAYTLTPACTTRGYNVNLKAALFDNWGTEATLNFVVNGQIVHSITHTGTPLNEQCSHAAADNEYIPVIFGFNATEASLRFVITSAVDGDQGTWGVCDVLITEQPCRVDSHGDCIVLTPLLFTSLTKGDDDVSAYTPAPTAERTWFTYGSRRVFGNYGAGETVTRTWTNLPAHQSVTVRFRFYSIDSWDREPFWVRETANGQNLWEVRTHWRDQWRAYITEDAGRSWPDEYINAEFTIPHTDGTLNLIWGSDLDQALNDESWAISDLVVFINPCAVGEAPNGEVICGRNPAEVTVNRDGTIDTQGAIAFDDCTPIRIETSCAGSCQTDTSYVYNLLRERSTYFKFWDPTVFWRVGAAKVLPRPLLPIINNDIIEFIPGINDLLGGGPQYGQDGSIIDNTM